MMNFKFKVIILVMFSFVLLASCSKKTDNTVLDENGNPVVEEAPTPQEPVVEDAKDAEVAQKGIFSFLKFGEEEQSNEEDKYKDTINYAGIKNKYNLIPIVYNILNDNLKAVVNLNKDTNFFIEAEMVEEVISEETVDPETGDTIITETVISKPKEGTEPSDARIVPLIMSDIANNMSVKKYVQDVLPTYQLIATSTFISKRKISVYEIRSFGAYIDANVVAVKSFFEPSIGKYIYDIAYLKGDVLSTLNMWYRSSSEAVTLGDSLKKLSITDINSYSNVLNKVIKEVNVSNIINADANKETLSLDEQVSVALEQMDKQRANKEADVADNKATEVGKIETPVNPEGSEGDTLIEDEYQAQGDLEADNSAPPPVVEVKKSLYGITSPNANDSENDVMDNPEEVKKPVVPVKVPTVEAPPAKDPLEGLDLDTLQKDLIAFRTDIIVGSWQDLHSGEIVEIRELPGNSDKAKSKRYAAYEIIDEELPPLVINNALNWLNEDLKFEFSSLSGEALFLNKEKMVSKAYVRLFPAKGMLIVTLPNKNLRYFIPVLSEIEESVYNELYLETETKYKPREETVNNSRYASYLSSTEDVYTSMIAWSGMFGVLSIVSLLVL